MDDKEFRKLRREDLIEIIYQYQRREQRLVQENQALKTQLDDRRIRMEKAGSIAEAALALSGIFDTAQKAADMYLQSVKELAASAPEKKTLPEQKPASQEKQKPAAPAAQPVQQKHQEPKKTAQQKEKSQVPGPAAEKTAPVLPTDGKLPKPAAPEQKVQKAEGPSSAQPVNQTPEKAVKPQKPAAAPAKAPAASYPAGKPAQIPGKPPVRQPVKAQDPHAGKPAAGRIPAKPAPAEKISDPGGETDEFIASLKDYLGM